MHGNGAERPLSEVFPEFLTHVLVFTKGWLPEIPRLRIIEEAIAGIPYERGFLRRGDFPLSGKADGRLPVRKV